LSDLQKSGDFFVENVVKFWHTFFQKSLILQKKNPKFRTHEIGCSVPSKAIMIRKKDVKSKEKKKKIHRKRKKRGKKKRIWSVIIGAPQESRRAGKQARWESK
jgi:hypothetical protein